MIATSAAFQPAGLLKEYKLSLARVRQIVLVICLSAGMSLVCWLPAIFETNETLSTRIGISMLGLFVALPVFFGIYQLFRLGGVSLSLYENGLIYHRRGGQEFNTSWEDIEAYIEADGGCRITKRDGQMVEFGASLEDVVEVIQAVHDQTLSRMLPLAKASLHSGGSLQFAGLKPFGKGGPGKGMNNFAFANAGYRVDAGGITGLDDGARIAWNAVKGYGIRTQSMGRVPVDVFFIEDGQTRFQTRLGLLSNAHLLLALCAELTGFEPEG